MNQDKIHFFQEILAKSTSIPVIHITKENKKQFQNTKNTLPHTYWSVDNQYCFDHYFQNCTEGGIHHIITPIQTQFCFLCISKEKEEHIAAGPFLDTAMTDTMLYETIDLLQLPIHHAPSLKNWYQKLAVSDRSYIEEIFQIMRRHLPIQQNTNPAAIFDFRQKEALDQVRFFQPICLKKDETIQLTEDRYDLEKQMLRCIAAGDVDGASKLSDAFQPHVQFMVQTKDSIRSQKNMLIVINTLFRTAAQEGGVHPVYLDETSTKWTIRIENAVSQETLNTMSKKMIRSYCILVKNHSLSQYSPLVKKAVNYIHLNLSKPLTVSLISNEAGICTDYLTRLFKKELQMPIITYINKNRIEASLRLLNTTDLSIQDIGFMVGINDTSYFNKLFKKHIGVSPKQYRESLY